MNTALQNIPLCAITHQLDVTHGVLWREGERVTNLPARFAIGLLSYIVLFQVVLLSVFNHMHGFRRCKSQAAQFCPFIATFTRHVTFC